jgi:hypothetical protein
LDVEQRIALVARPGLPTLPLVIEMPLLVEPDPDLLDAFLLARARAVDPEMAREWMGDNGLAVARGRPPRNAYVECEIAYLADIEGRAQFSKPSAGQGWQPEPTEPRFRDQTQRAYLNPNSVLTVASTTWATGTTVFRDETLKKARSSGRRRLAALGAWPWALWPSGRLPRNWKQQDRTWATLHAWATGR